ncbi:hypothetical protein HY498_00975 [Candidatus Woesearchaeota archaeon]|nr:hypothetical protein [Candidatus Woesearchaeota archaeon]
MKKSYLALILIILVILIGCSKKITETTSEEKPKNEVKTEEKKTEVKTEENPKAVEVKKEKFELNTDQKRYSAGSNLGLTFVNNYDKDVKIRYEDGLKLVKLESDSAINYGVTKLACECGQQCEAKINTESIAASGSFTIPMLFNLQIESCSKGSKVMRNLESGVYKAEIDYLERGEIEVWRKISSNTFIVTR